MLGSLLGVCGDDRHAACERRAPCACRARRARGVDAPRCAVGVSPCRVVLCACGFGGFGGAAAHGTTARACSASKSSLWRID
eukprot:6685026-Prymnesium_polylepis.1